MKDIQIKWKWIIREVIILVIIYILANVVNIAAILAYGTSMNEIFSSQGYVLYIAEWLYIASIVIRLIYFGVRILLKKR